MCVDVTDRLSAAVGGRVYSIPSSVKTNEIAPVLRQGYGVGLLDDGVR